MALQTFVKISNVSNLSDARYCSGMMVDVLGFNIDPSSEVAIPEQDFSEITEWLSGVQIAGEFSSASVHDIKETIKTYSVDLIELTNLDLVEEVHLLGKPIVVKLTVNQHNVSKLKSQLSYLDELASMAILTCDDSTLFEHLDTQIGFYNGNLKLLKGYGINASSSNLHRYPGIALEATQEEKPGFKDYGDIMDVLESLDED